MNTNKIVKATFLFVLFFAFLNPIKAQTFLNYFSEADIPQYWTIPYAYDDEGSALHFQFPDENYDFTTFLGMRFTPEEDGRLQTIHVFVSDLLGSEPDSVENFSKGEATTEWTFPFTYSGNKYLSYAQRFTAPYTGFLEEISFDIEKLGSDDGFNDSLEIGFYRKELNKTTEVAYWNPGVVWLFGVPNNSGTVTGYGTRLTTPVSSSDSLKLLGVDVFVFNINDDRFFTGFDTPPNDTLLVNFHTVQPSDSLPDQILYSTKIPFSNLIQGSTNRINIENEVLFFDSGEDVFVTLEVLVNGNQDHIGLTSGASFSTPINRSAVREDGNWIYISESNAWGGGSANGAEIQISGIFDDPNPQTPDLEEPLAEPVRINLSNIANGSVNIPINDLRLFQNEDVWVTISTEVIGAPDTVVIFSDVPSLENNGDRSVALIEDEEDQKWIYLNNTSGFAGNNYNFAIAAKFTRETNDRLKVQIYSNNTDSLPDQLLNEIEVPFTTLEENTNNQIDVSNWLLDLTAEEDVHLVFSTSQIGKTDGIVFVSDAGSSSSSTKRATFKTSKFDTWKFMSDDEISGFTDINFDWSLELQLSTSNERVNEIPKDFALQSVYPNPFNPSTTIEFSNPIVQRVQLDVFDILGRKVAALINNERMNPGKHTFLWNASNLGSGVYYIRLTNGREISTYKVSLIK